MKNFDLGIRCDYLLTMAHGKVEVLRDFFLGIEKSRITEIAPWKSGQWKASRMLDASANQVVMPGLVNGHTHLPMSLFKGLADDLPFIDWLNRYIIPLEGKLVSPDFVRTGTALSVLELIRSGVTTVCDMYYFEDTIAEVLDEMGIRGLVGEAIMDFPSPDNADLSGNNWKILEKMREKYRGHPRITPCYAPHAPYSCSDDTLKMLKKVYDLHPLPIIIHVAETEQEVEDSKKNFGMTPVARLHALGILGKKTIVAHGVHLSEEDIELLKQTGTSVVYNPESNMKLGAGVAPIPRLLKRGVKVGIGTDGSASNNDLSIFREMDSGVKVQKLTHRDNTAMTAPQVLSLATWGGAHALGLGDQIGSLEIGKKADVIILGLNHPHLQPLHDLASQLVYSVTGQEVETVICEGDVLYHEGKYPRADVAAIQSRVSYYQDRIQEVIAGSR